MEALAESPPPCPRSEVTPTPREEGATWARYFLLGMTFPNVMVFCAVLFRAQRG